MAASSTFQSEQMTRGGLARGVALAPGGKLLATAGSDRSLRFWDLETGALRQTIDVAQEGVYALDWHPAGRLLAATTGEGDLVWLELAPVHAPRR